MVVMRDEGTDIIVQDNGIGIPAEALSRLTESFYRVDKSRSRKRGGSGLGLSLCAKIAELHSGEINFKSRENKGTKVTVSIRKGRENYEQ
jgi:signal transduction histidine kinase